MDFELIDGFLLNGAPSKDEVVRRLLAQPPPSDAVAPFYDGMRLLGARTPELTLLALRLVLAGKRADDAAVVRLREAAAQARSGDASGRAAYLAELAP